MEQRTDVVIVGAGPAGIFTALEMLRGGSQKNIVIVEKDSRSKSEAAPSTRRRSA